MENETPVAVDGQAPMNASAEGGAMTAPETAAQPAAGTATENTSAMQATPMTEAAIGISDCHIRCRVIDSGAARGASTVGSESRLAITRATKSSEPSRSPRNTSPIRQ